MKDRRCMSSRIAAVLIWVITLSYPATQARADGGDVQTIVLIRHGEKPAAGLGQLSCQGLNRALALPRLIESRFGAPDAIFAPDPARQKKDHGVRYDYVRPLATVEPTAIYFGLPVRTSFGFDEVEGLRRAILAPAYRRALVVVAWEHAIVEQLARRIVAQYGGDAAQVPRWPGSDYDSIYLIRITRTRDAAAAVFSAERQGLDNLPTSCPGEQP
jgi:hypothetical protein